VCGETLKEKDAGEVFVAGQKLETKGRLCWVWKNITQKEILNEKKNGFLPLSSRQNHLGSDRVPDITEKP